MSGHSKWANIKYRKAKVDAQRGKIFTRLGRELMVAVKEGGPDPENNVRLKLAVQKAREANMPNENIARVIQRASGEAGGENFTEALYEGYGPGGVAVLLEILTDNRNRTAAEIRHLFNRYGGSLGESGCVAWMFESQGVVQVPVAASREDVDDIMLQAIESGADDVNDQGDYVEIITAPDQMEGIKEALEGVGYRVERAEIAMIPKTTVPINDPDQARRVLHLLDALEEHDDVQEVYANFDIPDDLMEEMQEA